MRKLATALALAAALAATGARAQDGGWGGVRGEGFHAYCTWGNGEIVLSPLGTAISDTPSATINLLAIEGDLSPPATARVRFMMDRDGQTPVYAVNVLSEYSTELRVFAIDDRAVPVSSDSAESRGTDFPFWAPADLLQFDALLAEGNQGLAVVAVPSGPSLHFYFDLARYRDALAELDRVEWRCPPEW